MWIRINLRAKFYVLLALLVFITMAGGAVMVWYTFRMEKFLSSVIDEDVAAFQNAEALASALVNQKGFVSYYFIDGDPDWLNKLGKYRQIFREKFDKIRSKVEDAEEKQILDEIDKEYTVYIDIKDRVISLYNANANEKGGVLHKEARALFFKTLNLCEEYRKMHLARINQVRANAKSQAETIRMIAGASVFVVFVIGAFLAFFIMNHILGPVRRLLKKIDKKSGQLSEDEIISLSMGVHGLIQDVNHTRAELEKSREHLLQSEKLAMVGKLAAGMAHSIRNPFTSVKMRLFSLGRSLKLTETEKEDFDVISEEIRHIDAIVQNFLEFSRPPKLVMQEISPSVVVDMAIQLLEHRLKSYNMSVDIVREQMPPTIEADPEQLKEVLVNIVVNACESMDKGEGMIIVHEETISGGSSKSKAIIRISDNGPGIPDALKDKIFQPFFTTKEEGTGLGLSIAARIIQEHGGEIDIDGGAAEGAAFIISLPVKE